MSLPKDLIDYLAREPHPVPDPVGIALYGLDILERDINMGISARFQVFPKNRPNPFRIEAVAYHIRRAGPVAHDKVPPDLFGASCRICKGCDRYPSQVRYLP